MRRLLFTVLLLCGAAQAHDEADALRVVARLEAAADGCTDARPGQPDTRAMAAEIERFRRSVPEAAGVDIALRECFWDGMVVQGERIVISTRLARATPAQRFFVIAHELGHLAGRHHARFVERTAALLASGTAEAAVVPALSPLSRSNELEADAFAAALMRRAGLDPEAAARFLDAAGGAGSATHPSPAARARAIRETAAAYASAF